MLGKKGMREYPVQLKLEAIRLYYEEGKTCAEVTARLGIGNTSAVKEWGQLYRCEGVRGLKKTKGRPVLATSFTRSNFVTQTGSPLSHEWTIVSTLTKSPTIRLTFSSTPHKIRLSLEQKRLKKTQNSSHR